MMSWEFDAGGCVLVHTAAAVAPAKLGFLSVAIIKTTTIFLYPFSVLCGRDQPSWIRYLTFEGQSLSGKAGGVK